MVLFFSRIGLSTKRTYSTGSDGPQSDAQKTTPRPIPAAFRRSWLQVIRSNVQPLTHLGLAAIILALSLKLSRLQGENWMYYDNMVEAQREQGKVQKAAEKRREIVQEHVQKEVNEAVKKGEISAQAASKIVEAVQTGFSFTAVEDNVLPNPTSDAKTSTGSSNNGTPTDPNQPKRIF
eukprot:TRINITY_DN8807_c0_g1_i1.p1 TRINITY_DN8807_c0_g1~~TRINITY_DN8807_c0_g1_i1.p1  ORF type:complete len:178 (+),score=43.01 TRINITY_DN8807_c0_g1_i1:44-577(+)